MNRKLLPKNRNAFTLVELLVVIFIIAILFAIGTVAYAQGQIVGRNGKRAADLHLLATALEQYYQDHGFYPNTTVSGAVQFQPAAAGAAASDSINCLLGAPTITASNPPHVVGGWVCSYNDIASAHIDILGPYKVYLPKLPTDPKTNVPYGYASDGQKFTLTTISYEGAPPAAPAPPADHVFTSAKLFYSEAGTWGRIVRANQYVVTSKGN